MNSCAAAVRVGGEDVEIAGVARHNDVASKKAFERFIQIALGLALFDDRLNHERRAGYGVDEALMAPDSGVKPGGRPRGVDGDGFGEGRQRLGHQARRARRSVPGLLSVSLT